MLEAMYGVEFVSNVVDVNNIGCGVVVLETGRILGGDSSFIYIGNYETNDGTIQAKIKCTNDRELAHSIFGDVKEFTLQVEGKLDHNEFLLHGYVIENPEMKIGINLTRRAELP